jgi:hypothetical protein
MRTRFLVAALVAAHIFVALWVAPASRAADAPDTTSILDQLVEQRNATVQKTSDGLALTATDRKTEAKLVSTATFKPPLVITAVVQTDSLNIRFYYANGWVIFNWEERPSEVQYHDPKSRAKTVAGDSYIAPNKWATIQWVITKDESRMLVDGVERVKSKGDFTSLSGKPGVGTVGKARVTFKSLTVSSGTPGGGGGGGGEAVSKPDPNMPVDITIPSGAPAALDPASLPAGDPDAIDRPYWQNKPKRLVKNLASVTSLMVRIADDGQATGFTSDIIATVPAQSRTAKKSGIGFARVDGDTMMKTALNEAVRAVQLRYPLWEYGHIDISFGEKFNRHGGPSAGTAFGLLMLSCLEGWDIDPKCAVTGDITVDWKVRKVGGVTAKLRGATLDKCLYAAIPVDNETAFADMALLYGNSSQWEIQVFSIANLQQAVAIARTDRAPKLAEAVKLFAELQSRLVNAEKATIQSQDTRQVLKHILELAPNHLSAKHLLALCEGTAPKTLSANATIYQLSVIFYPYRVVLASHRPIDRTTLPSHVTALARKRLNNLRPIAHKDLQGLLTDMAAFAEAMDGLAGNTTSFASVKARADRLDARFEELDSDPAMVEKLIREGY